MTKYRTHTCLSCNHQWTSPVVMSASSPAISGERTEQCPQCSHRGVASSPHHSDASTPKQTSEPFYRTTLFYARLTGLKQLTSDYEQTLVRDMLADMLHYCREYGVDFEAELAVAHSHFREEIQDRKALEPKITAIKRESIYGSCTLTATFDDGCEKLLFSYYIDELAFADADLIGLTEDEAHQLRQKRDTEYLRS